MNLIMEQNIADNSGTRSVLALGAHGEVCAELYELMLEENRSLKASGRGREEVILERKRKLLGELKETLEEMRSAGSERVGTSAEMRVAMEKVQQTILKALLLDRENEQLLLRSTIQPRVVGGGVAVGVRPVASQVGRLYGKFT